MISLRGSENTITASGVSVDGDGALLELKRVGHVSARFFFASCLGR